MHTFQSYPINMLEMNPFTKIGKEWALISAGSKKEFNIMTVSWGGLGVLWGKNVVYIFIRDSRFTKEFLDEGEFFSMAFLSENFRDALNYCGSHSGRSEDKLANAGLTPAQRLGIPFPDESNLVLFCRKLATIPITEDTFNEKHISEKFYSGDNAGDLHTMYVGAIIEVIAR